MKHLFEAFYDNFIKDFKDGVVVADNCSAENGYGEDSVLAVYRVFFKKSNVEKISDWVFSHDFGSINSEMIDSGKMDKNNFVMINPNYHYFDIAKRTNISPNDGNALIVNITDRDKAEQVFSTVIKAYSFDDKPITKGIIGILNQMRDEYMYGM